MAFSIVSFLVTLGAIVHLCCPVSAQTDLFSVQKLSDDITLAGTSRVSSGFSIRNQPFRNGMCPGHAFFSADNGVKLFVNGAISGNEITNWHFFGTAQFFIKVGGVIALNADDTGAWFGAVATVKTRGLIFQTSIDDWRAIPADISLADSWMDPHFDACQWPKAITRPGKGTYNPGKSDFFPYETGAEYVWAAGVAQKSRIYLRYRIGGECGRGALIIFGAFTSASLFINNRLLGSTSSPGSLLRKNTLLRIGDVVSVLVEHSPEGSTTPGVIVYIKLRGKGSKRSIATGDDNWKTTIPTGVFDNNNQLLRHATSSCRWANPIKVSVEVPLLLKKRAEYVWLPGPMNRLLFRYVIGEEQCDCSPLTPKSLGLQPFPR